MKHFGDITQLQGYDLPVVDVIVGGSPCQDLSLAGRRAGLDGERSGLFMEQIRIVKEMREKDERSGRTGYMVRPRYLVWENVPGAFSSNGGEDFRIVLEEICKVADKDASVPRPPQKWSNAGCIMGDGWSVAWRVHNAQFWGVAQRRRRISLVADFGGLSASEILFERKGMSRDPKQGEQAWENSSGSVATSIRKPEPRLLESNQNKATIQSDGICTTLPAAMGMGGGYVPMIAGTIDSNYYKGCGERQGTERDVVCVPSKVQAVKPSFCIGNGQAHIASHITYEVAQTLNCMHDQLAVAVDCRNGVESEVNASLQSSACHNLNSNNVCRDGFNVRRLTPLECERLQGMPDNWSKYGLNEKGEVYELSDSARYRLQGNGIATPFWRWMMKRISAQYERTPTLGSLFDGQGSFPMIWEGINGKGSAVWASEIEKNAIAVTKYHFPEEGNDATHTI